MSYQDDGKKEIERSHLDIFITDYSRITKMQFPEIYSSESPDFICTRSDGITLGIELVNVMRDPESAQFDRLLYHKLEADSQETLDNIYYTIEKKDDIRSRNYGEWSDKTILVMILSDCQLSNLHTSLTEDLREDFSQYGFKEIWLADYTGIEAYGDIELFGLYPSQWWGYHQRDNPCRKPYG